ncbi:MAG: hypothetical protein PHI48_00930 [Bacteroidales bacterium]|nr:hypothetical protein [Bacteroidales bacterium]
MIGNKPMKVFLDKQGKEALRRAIGTLNGKRNGVRFLIAAAEDLLGNRRRGLRKERK